MSSMRGNIFTPELQRIEGKRGERESERGSSAVSDAIHRTVPAFSIGNDIDPQAHHGAQMVSLTASSDIVKTSVEYLKFEFPHR